MISTDRLDLVPATLPLLGAALRSSEELGRQLGFAVAPGWPPEFLDDAAFDYTLTRLTQAPEEAGWWLYFVVERNERMLIGSAGYKGPPTNGEVEIGYGITIEHRRRGYASEAAAGLARHAFSKPEVDRVAAETFPHMVESIGVLEKCGFVLAGAGSEPGVVRYRLSRS